MNTTWLLVLAKFPVGKKFTYLDRPAVVIDSKDDASTHSYFSPGYIKIHTSSDTGIISEILFEQRQAAYLLSL